MYALRATGLVGGLVFGVLLFFTYFFPDGLESAAKDFVVKQVEKEVIAKYEAGLESPIGAAANTLIGKLGVEKRAIQSKLDSNLPYKIASILASMCGYDCEKKKRIAEGISSGYLERIKRISLAQDTLRDLVKGKYLSVVGKLKRDVRIFLGTNLSLFIVLVLVSLVKPQARQHLYLPAFLLVVATVASSLIYLFGQNWIYTIIYNDYVGFGYLAYALAIYGLLIDVVINRARLTAKIVNVFANALGSAFSIGPC